MKRVLFNGHGYVDKVVNQRVYFFGREWIVGIPQDVDDALAKRLLIRTYFVEDATPDLMPAPPAETAPRKVKRGKVKDEAKVTNDDAGGNTQSGG